MCTFAVLTKVYYQGKYKNEILDLMKNSKKWKFSAARASAQQISEFKIEDMARAMKNDDKHLEIEETR